MRTLSERSSPNVYRRGPGYSSTGPSYTQILICLQRLSPGQTTETRPPTFYVEVYTKCTDSKRGRTTDRPPPAATSLPNNILASALLPLAHCSFSSCPESRSQKHSEKDLLGSFSNPFGAVMAGFDNRCRVKRVQGIRACVAMQSNISDRIIWYRHYFHLQNVLRYSEKVLSYA